MSDELKPCPCCGNTHLETTANVNESSNLGRCGAVWCECGLHMSARSLEEAMARWNARAAVTDEQFALAVHDGRAWQRVRECHMVPVSLYDEEGVDGIECDECGWSDVHEWYDPMPEFCPSCGAKVAG